MANFGRDFAAGFNAAYDTSAIQRGYQEARVMMRDRKDRETATKAGQALQGQLKELESHEALAKDAYRLAVREGATPEEKNILQMDLVEATKAKLFGSMNIFNQFVVDNPGNVYAERMAQAGIKTVGLQLKTEMEGWKMAAQRRANAALQEDQQKFLNQDREDTQAHQLELQKAGYDIKEMARSKALGEKASLTMKQFHDVASENYEHAVRDFETLWSDEDMENLKAKYPNLSDEKRATLAIREIWAQRQVNSGVFKSMDEVLGKRGPAAQQAFETAKEEDPESTEKYFAEGLIEYLNRAGAVRDKIWGRFLDAGSPAAGVANFLLDQEHPQDQEGPQSSNDAVGRIQTGPERALNSSIANWDAWMRGEQDTPGDGWKRRFSGEKGRDLNKRYKKNVQSALEGTNWDDVEAPPGGEKGSPLHERYTKNTQKAIHGHYTGGGKG